MASALAACLAFGAVVSSIGLILGHVSEKERFGSLVISGVALLLGGAVFAFRRRLPELAFDATLAAGTLLVTAGLHTVESGGRFYSVLYVWLGGFAFYFLPRRRAFAQLALLTIVFGTFVLIEPVPQAGVNWLLIVSSATVCGLLVMTLRATVADSDDRFEHAFHDAPIGMALVGPDGCVEKVNEALCELLEREPADVLHRPLAEQWDGGEDPGTAASGVQVEHHFRRPGGESRWVQSTAVPMDSDDGGKSYAVVQVIDVTGRRRAERAAQHAAALRAAIVESSEDAIHSQDLDGTITSWNTGAERLYGYSSDEMVGRSSLTLTAPRGEQQERELLALVAAGHRVDALEIVRRHRDGSALEVSATLSPIYDEGGRVVGASSIARDISARRRFETALQQSESRYRAMFEGSPLPLFVYDLETLRFTAVNEAAIRQYGYSREELLAMTIHDLREAGEMSHLERALSQGVPARSVRGQHRRKDGSVVDVAVTSEDQVFEGRPSRLVLAKDVTEQVRALEELRQSEERYRNIIETAAEGIWLLDEHDRTTFVNPRMAEMLGYATDELLGRPAADFLAPHGLRRLRSDDRETVFEYIRKDGTTMHALVSTRVRHAPDGSYAGVLAMLSDVTERVRAEEEGAELQTQLSRSQRLEGIGRLAGGIAHDFNNLLAVILNYAEFLVEESDEKSQTREDAEEIRRAAERAAALTRQLLVFSRREAIQREPLHLGGVVREMEKLLRRTIGEDIDLTVEVADDVPAICADRAQMDQLLLNLVINARDAMPQGGTLAIKVATHEVPPEASAALEPGVHVCLTVCDTGQGIPADIADRVFDPFFTTKAAQEGTGLGLATVYGVVTQSGGQVDFESNPGGGTTFRVLLPAAAAEVVVARGTGGAAQAGGGETIMLVEDEPAVRNLTHRILAANGYRVVDAADGEEALALEAGYERLDLLLTDVVMPGRSGQELAAEMGRRRPDTPVLFMSGYTDDVVMRQGVIEGQFASLEKPFTASTLLQAVRDAIQGSWALAG